MTYEFDRLDINKYDAAEEIPSTDGRYVLAEDAINREASQAQCIDTLKAQLAAAHAKGSEVGRVDAKALFAKLRKLADDAWPEGPYRADLNLNWAYPQTVIKDVRTDRVVMRFVNAKPQYSCTIGKAEYEWRNSDFFAAMSPEVVLFLLDHINYLGTQNEQAVRS